VSKLLLFLVAVFGVARLPLHGQTAHALGTDFSCLYLTELRTPHSLDTVHYQVSLTNHSGRDLDLVLELRNPFIRHIWLRWQTTGHSDTHRSGQHPGRKALVFNAGASLPFRERPLPTRYFSFPLHLAAGESAVLNLGIHNQGFRDRVAVELHEKSAYDALTYRRITVLATYFAGGIFTLVFGFIILAVIRAYIRFSYIYYFGIGLVLVATLQGLGYQYFWPQAPGVQNVIKPILLNATFLGGFRFLQRFFQTETESRWIDYSIYFLMFGLGVLASVALATPSMDVASIALYQRINDLWFLGCTATVAVLPLVYYIRTRLREAFWFWVAYSVLMAAVFTGIGSGLGWYHTRPMLDNWIWAGMLLLHVVISALILERVRLVVETQARARLDLEREKWRQLRDLVIHEEMERDRIGADLHDEAGSRFAAMKMALSRMAYREEEPTKAAALADIMADVDEICDQNRTISHRLLSVSLNQVGLPEALREYQARLLAKGRHVVFRPSPGLLDGLSDTAEILIYRVIQEVVEGLYEEASTFRILLQDSDDGKELVLTVEPLDEPLPAPPPDSLTLSSLRTRLALFSAVREESLQFLESGLRIWLPKAVEAMVS
jgi:signal transduction histidine kinase